MSERCDNPRIILQEIVSKYDNSRKWTATCRCGWWWRPGAKKECTAAIAEHSGGQDDAEHLMTGPKIITSKSGVAIPSEFPADRWVWHAHNESEEGESWYHGLGRSELEAIEDLHATDDVRRMARWHQSTGFPRNAEWLDFFRYTS